jgi:predicted LPLAT superfamily acyltransferase
MPTWQGKSKGNTAGYKIFVFLMKTLGLIPAYFILRLVAFYYFLFSKQSTKSILYFYKVRLKLGTFKSYIILYSNYYRFGQTLIDKVAIMANIPTNFTFDFEGEHYLKEMVALKKGGLLLSAHVGNWEAAGHLLERINARINIVMYDGEDAQIKKYINSVTVEKTFNIIFIHRNDLSHIFKINEALSKGELVCMHADRFISGNKTLTNPFLDEEALFPEGPYLLALKLKVPVAFVYAFKESNKHYRLFSTELKYFNQANGDTSKTILNQYTQSLEEMVKRYPEQWFNYYDFWKE